MEIKTWEDLSFWQSDDWKNIQEKLDEMDTNGTLFCPARHLLFRSLSETPRNKVRAVLVGQDPYTNYGLASGLAFSVPRGINGERLPPSLKNILEEYHNDLHYPYPKHGDLSSWAKAGVLLINCFWSVGSQPRSHHGYPWDNLTKEVLSAVDNPTVPIVLLGGVAHSLIECIHSSPVLRVSHPSPLGARKGRNPFMGSRIFTSINGLIGRDTIDWRIPDVYK
jgi:uracil-DNA glycosylase